VAELLPEPMPRHIRIEGGLPGLDPFPPQAQGA
jgi:hypothetical protein